MMKSIRRVALLAAIAFVSLQSVNAQDIGFSQFYANPLYLNPAMAGSKIAPSLSLTYRCQWPALTSAYQTASISYDQYIDKLHGSIGAIAMYDRQGDHGALNTTYVGLMYAFRFNLTRDVFMNLALEAAVFNVHLKWDLNYLHFPDQIDPSQGFVNQTSAQEPENNSKWNADFSAGLMVYGENWYAGASGAHLSRPDQGFYSVDRIPIKVTVHGGGMINLAKEKRRTSTLGLGTPIISPNFIYQYQGTFHYFNYSLYLDWEPFLVGMWFRNGVENADAFIFLAGIQWDHYKVGYSYDVTVSKLANNTHGSHEVTLGILLPVPQHKQKVRAIRCPSF